MRQKQQFCLTIRLSISCQSVHGDCKDGCRPEGHQLRLAAAGRVGPTDGAAAAGAAGDAPIAHRFAGGRIGILSFSEMFNGILEDLEDEDPLDPFEVLGIEVQMLQLGRKGGKYGENGENGEVGTYRNHVFQNLRLKIQGSQLQHSKRLKVKWSRFTVGSR